MLPEHYGCVVFDDPHEHAAGYAASTRNPGAAYRIAGTGDLESDSVWLTNLDYTLTRESGLGGHARFRRADFFRRYLDHLCESCGLSTAAVNIGHPPLVEYIETGRRTRGGVYSERDLAPAKAVALAGLTERTMRLTVALTGMTFVPQYRLNLGLREMALPADPVLPEYMLEALEDAVVRKSTVERSVSVDGSARIAWYRLPPVAHALKILALPVPNGRWTPVEERGDIEAILGEDKMPFLAKATIKQVAPAFNRLINYGTGAGRRSARRWIASLEYRALTDIAEIRVHKLLVCDSVRKSPFLEQAVVRLSPEADKLEASVSAGLFAENLWTAVAARHNPDGGLRGNPATPFVHAVDRIACMSAALAVQDAGLDVVSYGLGTVAARIPYGCDERDIAKVAASSGTLPPAGLLPLDDAQRIFDLDTPLGIAQALHSGGCVGDLLNLDARIIESVAGPSGLGQANHGRA